MCNVKLGCHNDEPTKNWQVHWAPLHFSVVCLWLITFITLLTKRQLFIYVFTSQTLINQLYSCQKHVSDSAPTSSHQHTSPALAVVLLMLTPKIYLVLPTENTSSKLNPDDFLQIVVPLSLWHGTFVLCHVLLHLAVTQIAKQMGSWEDQAWFK